MATHVYETPRDYYGDRIVSRIVQAVWIVLSVIEVLLLLRFFLKLIGANASVFTDFIYRVTAPLMAPFQYTVGSTSAAGSVVEWSSIIALIVYWIVAWIIIALIDLARPLRHYEV